MSERSELVPDDVTPRELRDEAALRARRAGYPVGRDGGPLPRRIVSVNPWGRPKLNVWPRDAAGNLIE
jgi:hypothetical protein